MTPLLLLLLPLLLLLLLCGRSLSLGAEQPAVIRYAVKENTGAHATIGNIRRSLGGAGGSPSRFAIRPSSPYFSVDSEGNVKLKVRLDREDPSLCPEPSRAAPCVIEFSAFSSDSPPTRLLVSVTVEDVNDNHPVFKVAQKVLFIEEGDVSFKQPLDLATDADAGDNGMSQKGSYRLKDPSGIFELDTSQPGFLNLRLRGSPDKSQIDFEKERQYNLSLTACDGGAERRCSDQLLVVQVTDRNDNEPNISDIQVDDVFENLAIGGQVARIVANDRDSGNNAKLTFSIIDTQLAEQFGVDRDGRITLKRALNAKVKQRYSLPVRVSDSGTPPRYMDTKVEFVVKDLNDHSPRIEVSSMDSGTERISVAENTENKLLAFLSHSDDDLGENARTECQLAPGSDRRSFRLDASGKMYMLNLQKAFDFEETPSVSLRVQCHDFGSPRRNSTRRVTVHITNVNEFAPSFQGRDFYTSIRESDTDFGADVLRLAAVDEDRNESMTFWVDGSRHGSFFGVRNVSLRHEEGVGTEAGAALFLRRPVDRDTLGAAGDLMKFVVFVNDSADADGTQHSSSVTVTVSVSDVNDNAPQVLPPHVFEIRENCREGTRALAVPSGESRLRHSDPDLGVNSEAAFRLVSVAARRRRPDGGVESVAISDAESWPLNVTEAGEIRSSGDIDRESFESFSLTVVAANRGAKPPLSSSAVVTVEVLDENDNRPEWTFPTPAEFAINITAEQRLHGIVTTVEARDPDILSNVTYALTGGSGFFSVDRHTGHVRVTKELLPGRHELSIRADDNAKYNHPVYARLVINVCQRGGSLGQLKDSQVNLTIIVAMIVVTGVISVGLVFAIVCVRRRSQSFLADKEQCQCQCEMPDMDGMSPDPMYSHLCTHAPKFDRQFPMTTFSHNGSAYDLRPQIMEQQIRNEVVINQQDLDGDSADSGRGGSEDDHGGHLLNAARQLHAAGNSGTLPRRVMSPPPPLGHQKAPCQCLGIPEEDFHGCNDCGAVGQPSVGLHVPIEPPLGAVNGSVGNNNNNNNNSSSSSSSSFLPPALPPHGVEYRGPGVAQRSRPAYNPFRAIDSGECGDPQRLC